MSEPLDLLQIDAASREAAMDRQRSFIVDAPAGAGKTELLTQRFLALLTTVEDPEQVVALTFTNKAAAEMRHRVLSNLRKAEQGQTPTLAHQHKTYELALQVLQRDREMRWGLLEQVGRLQITTLDALCTRLTRQMPLLSRLGSQPAVALDAMAYYEEAAQATLRKLHSSDALSEVVARVLARMNNNSQQLCSLLVAMLARRDQWQSVSQQALDVPAMEQALSELISLELTEVLSEVTPALQEALMPSVRFIASQMLMADPEQDLLNNSRGQWLALESWTQALTASVQDLPLWQALANVLLTQKNVRKSIPKAFGFTKANSELKDDFKALLERLSDRATEQRLLALRLLPSPQYTAAESELLQDLQQLLNAASYALWQTFQRAKHIDFTGIAQSALRALGSDDEPSDLQLLLDYKIQHLLVDEFQDTSPTQVQLLERLTAGWTPGDGRTLFLVGDPMQSIYKFRKADVGLFLRIRDQGLGHMMGEAKPTALSLYKNNRSCPEIVDWCNRVLPSVFADHNDARRGAVVFKPAQASKTSQASLPGERVQWHPLLQSEDIAGDDISDAEAKRVIELIRQAQASGSASVAVLVRARTHLQSLLQRLRAEQPPLRYQAVEIECLADRQVVQDVLSLTKALLHLGDRVHWLALLRAPWCGLTLSDLHVLAGDDHAATLWQLMQAPERLARLSSDGQQRIAHINSVVGKALQHQGKQRTRRWVEGVWQALGGPLCLHGEADWLDVQAFFHVLDAMDAPEGVDLARLDGEVEKLFAAPDPQASEGLQIMTIHKSKGLEFDTVILPGLSNLRMSDDKPLVIWEEFTRTQTTPIMAAKLIADDETTDASKFEFLHQFERERSQHEQRRLLYVALTRAKHTLHLLGATKVKAGEVAPPAASSLLALLWHEAKPRFDAELSGTQTLPELCAPVLPLAAFRHQLVRLAAVGYPAALLAPMPSETATANDLPIEQRALTEDSQLAADIGTLVHRYLELMAGKPLGDWPAERIQRLAPVMQRWLQAQGHQGSEAEQAAATVVAHLQTTLASAHGQWVLAVHDQGQCEAAYTTSEAGVLRTHIIDRTFVEAGCRWIIDYKTTRTASAEKQLEYQAQLLRYRQLFADDIQVRCAIFYTHTGELSEVAV